MTNIAPDKMSASEVADVYRLRWHVELLFKELRSAAGIDAWPNRKEETFLTGVYATLLGMLVNRRLLGTLRDKLAADENGTARRLSHQRWTAVFASHARAVMR